MINQESSSTHPPTTPETWITPAETANATCLTLRTVINRAEKGKITAKGNDAAPLLNDGIQNFLIRLEALVQNAQLSFFNHIL